MKYQKKSITKIRPTIFFIVSGIFIYTFLYWVKLIFPWLNQPSLQSKYSEIHFSSPWNNFWWWTFWLNTESLPVAQEIKIWTKSIKCTKQLRGIYYNAARWSRLWPLDQKSFKLLNEEGGYSWLVLDWWLYTSCWSDTYWIFGYIKYSFWWIDSYIIAWTKLNYLKNQYLTDFANSFEYLNNVTPLWFIWDSIWWIWFVWGTLSWSEKLIGELNNWSNINSSFVNSWGNIVSTNPNWVIIWSWSSQAQDTMWNILIQWNTFISTAIAPDEKRALLGNVEKRTILMVSDLNPSDVINKAKKNAETLCRWKTYFTKERWTSKLNDNKENVLCYKDVENLEIDLSAERHKDKTIIMNNWNVTLKNSMNKNWHPLDLFIDWWVLVIDGLPEWKLQKTSFNQDGYPSENEAEEKSSWIFMKWNIVINWILIWGTFDKPGSIKNKVHLLWRIAFLNTPTTSSEWRKTQVNSVLGTKIYEPRISLENVFDWYCNFNGKANDDTKCWWPWSYSSATIVPFVVLNESYPSNIIK